MTGFLKLEGIHGESDNAQHFGEFDILSAVLGYSQANQDSDQFKLSGKVFSDVSLTKKNESDSHKLVNAAANGKTFAGGKITLESADKLSIIEMSNILIIAISSDNSIETISLSFEKPK